MSLERAVLGGVVAVVLSAIGCRDSGVGSISGTVYGTDDPEPPVALSAHVVYLLPATSDVVATLKSACPAGGAAVWKQTAAAERARLTSAAAVYADSSLVARRRSLRSEWMRLTHMQRLYGDSAARVPRTAPTISADLVSELATTHRETQSNGRYEFHDVAAGTYLLAVEIRDEIRWKPLSVVHSPAEVKVTPGTSVNGCEIVSGL